MAILKYNERIKTFHTKNMSVQNAVGYSRSPEKPALLMKYLDEKDLLEKYFEVVFAFPPFEREDFLIAHTPTYVDAFLNGTYPLCVSNGLVWSEELVTSVCYTNASLYFAIRSAIQNPLQLSFSPSSGFHHSRPNGGSGFCTFSGQVIASVKLYRELGLKGAWLDLDQHHGNSIDDSRLYAKDLNKAVPPGFNMNPESSGIEYIKNLKKLLMELEAAILTNRIDYVVFCHGADSHENDDLGGKLSTKLWIECSTIFFTWVKKLNEKRGKPLPVTMALFGGYREDDFTSVLSLHTSSLMEASKILLGNDINYTPEVKD